MDSSPDDKCADCGKTRSNVASITQWISLGDKCSCGSTVQVQNREVADPYPSSRSELCMICGGSRSKQNGSLTQWVFRIKQCKCIPGTAGEAGPGSPQGVLDPTDVSAVGASGSLEEQEAEIETEAGRFPIDRYAAIAWIGSGEQGAVYKAKDRLLNRIVCVKVLKTGRLLPEQVVRFQREAQTGAKLTHPNLTKVLDFGLTEAGQPFLVMEFCSGKELSELIRERGALPVELALKIFHQASDGMQYAHEHGVLHRDLKADNILVADIDSEYPSVKIIDFGLSGVALDTIDDTGKITHTGTMIGTPAYMSPEQALDQNVDERSDLYSLGCALFETLTGRQVFEANTVMELIQLQAHEEPPALADVSTTEFPPELELIVSQSLAKDPAARFQTMQDLKEAIEELVAPADEDDSLPETEVESRTANDALTLSTANLKVANATNLDDNGFKKNSKLTAVIPLVIVCAVIVGGFMAVKSIVSEFEVPQTITVSTLALADGTWTVFSGRVHGKNASQLAKHEKETHIKISDSQFSDEDLVHIQALPLKVLDLSGTNISDKGLKSIAEIKTIECLLIANNKRITDAGIAYINLLPNLKVLSLKSTNVTDIGVRQLQASQNLGSLDISGLDQVTVKSLRELVKLPNLLSLRIGGTSIQTTDLHVLRRFKLLKALSVAQLGLSDSDMPKLAALHLVLLDVSSNEKITAAGIQQLNPFTYWRLYFTNCGLTASEKMHGMKKYSTV